MKIIVFWLFALYLGISLWATPLDCGQDKWVSDPISVRALNIDSNEGMLTPNIAGIIFNVHPRSESIVYSAHVQPQMVRAMGKSWAVTGLILADGEHNFWQLAFVMPPVGSSFGPFCELESMRNGNWLSSTADGLKRTHFKRNGEWRTNETYVLKMELSKNKISGTITDLTGQLIFSTGFEFEDHPSVKVGRPGIRTSLELTAKFSEFDCESKNDLPEKVITTEYVPYRPIEPASAIYSSRATGFFRVEQGSDGLWWIVDPLGKGLYLSGVDHVKMDVFYCEFTQKNHHLDVNNAKYGTKAAWENSALKRLAAWGFNTLGCGCDLNLQHRGMAHTVYLDLGGRMAYADEWMAIRHNPNMIPCGGFPNVFDPVWPKLCDYVAQVECARLKDDPWLIGYFIDNELTWWGKVWDNGGATGLFDMTLALPESHTARKALVEFLEQRGLKSSDQISVAVKTDFLRYAAERYFSVATAAIRRVDPNHLVLGCRFCSLGGAHDVVWEVAGKYCDIVTCNIYPKADLARNMMLEHEREGSPKLIDSIRRRSSQAKRPLMVTEWSFPALDAGLPCKHGAGQRLKTQAERVRASELCARTFLASGCVVGANYFMWVDEPPEGIRPEFPEDSNYGLISAEDIPYPIAAMFAWLNRDVDGLRKASVPGENLNQQKKTGK